MLRPVLAFLTLGLAAFILAPTVTSVGKGVEDLNIVRPMPWDLWKRDDAPPPPVPPDCDYKPRATESEITSWPARLSKGTPITLAGHVLSTSEGKRGVGDIDVEIFLNETKEAPGRLLGATTTAADGTFTLTTRVPADASAAHYHLVAHSLERTIGCKHYKESWSDPEMDLTAKTSMRLAVADEVVTGQNLTIAGELFDEVGGPVRKANVTLTVEGERRVVTTDEDGEFSFEYLVEAASGDVDVVAEFGGTKFYGSSRAETASRIVPESVRLPPVEATRSHPTTVEGTVVMGAGVERGPVTLRFEGVRVVACEGCAPSATMQATPDAAGAFRATFTIPSTEPPGPFRVVVLGGGLREEHPTNGTLLVPVTLVVDAKGKGFLSKDYGGEVRAVDDAGEAAMGTVTVQGIGDPSTGPLDEHGVFAFQGSASCGFHDLTVSYGGDAHRKPMVTRSSVGVCGPLAYLPQWVLDTPAWLWPTTLVLAVAVVLVARKLREMYAPTIRRGPPLELRVTEPRDAAPGIVGVGEPVAVTAFLDDPLPQGHTLRMGTFRAMEPRLVADDLRATVEIVPDRPGDVPVRAEILNERGRVVSRRTLHVRAVRYAAEIERRYRALKAEQAGDDLDVVTPREFERWLRERAPDLDPATARRLVGLFEEADYGPREAGREELLAYLDAERGIPEVAARAA